MKKRPLGRLYPGPNDIGDESIVWRAVGKFQRPWRSVGGSLSVTTKALYFTPDRLDAFLRAKQLRIAFEEISDIEDALGQLVNFRVHLRDGSHISFKLNENRQAAEVINNQRNQST